MKANIFGQVGEEEEGYMGLELTLWEEMVELLGDRKNIILEYF